MSPLLDDKPGHQYDDKMGWYNPNPPSDDLEDSFNAPSATDEDLPKDHPSRKKSLSDDELAAAEGSAKAKKEGDSDDPSGELEGLYKPSKKKTKGKGRGITRKQGGVAGFIIALIIAAFMAIITQGPGLVITHLRDMLLSRVGQVQMYDSRKYRQGKLSKLRNLFSKDGRMTNNMIYEMERRGYKIKKVRVTFGVGGESYKTLAMNRPDGTAIDPGKIGDEIDDFMESRHPFRSARWKTKRMDAFYTKFKVTRTSPVDKAKSSPDENPKKTVNKEMAKDVVDDNPQDIKSPRANDGEDATDADRAANEAADEIDELSEESAKSFDDEIENLKAGEAADKAFEGIEEGTSPETLDMIEKAAKGSLGGRAWNAIKSFVSPTDIMDKLCTMRNRLRQAQAAGRTMRAVKMMRYAATFIKAGDDIRRGKVDMKLVNELMKRVMSEDTNGNSFSASAGFNSVAHGKFSKSQNHVTRNKIGVDGKLEGILGGLKEFTDTVPGMSGCWFWQNPGAQVVTGAASAAASAVSCVFAGCAAGAAQAMFQAGVKTTIKEIISKAVKKIITKKVIKSIALGLAINIGIEGAMAYMQLYAQKTMMLPFTGQETGGVLGNILTAGTGTMNKSRSSEAGLVPATADQYAQATQEYYAWKKKDLAKQSFFARTFDFNNPDSLAFNGLTMAIGAGSGGYSTAVSNVANMTTNLFSGGFMSDALSLFGGSANAAADDVAFDTYTVDGGSYNGTKLATDVGGNVQYIMRSDIEEIDPEDNQAALIASGDIDSSTYQPTSSAFKKYMEKCVDTTDILSSMEFESVDCMAEKSQTKKFAAHLAYLDMMDGLEAEFDPGSLDSSSGGGSGAAAGPTTTGGTGPIDISQTSPIPGAPDFRIATTVLPQLTDMLAAARKDGIELLPLSSAWRDPQKQIDLRKQNCPDWQNSPPNDCNPPTAKPGTSNHEGGRAVDFENMCYPNASCPGNPRWEWLHAHAAEFGFYPLASEAWHWSTTGK